MHVQRRGIEMRIPARRPARRLRKMESQAGRTGKVHAGEASGAGRSGRGGLGLASGSRGRTCAARLGPRAEPYLPPRSARTRQGRTGSPPSAASPSSERLAGGGVAGTDGGFRSAGAAGAVRRLASPRCGLLRLRPVRRSARGGGLELPLLAAATAFTASR